MISSDGPKPRLRARSPCVGGQIEADWSVVLHIAMVNSAFEREQHA